MKRLLWLVMALLLLTAPIAMAEEYFPPQGAGKGVIGGRNGEAWRVGYFESIVLGTTGTTNVLIPSTLATNAVDAANSIWGVSNGLVGEGATADAHETTLTFTDPTADVLYQFPTGTAGTYYPMVSTLATNQVGIANSIWGGTNQIILEGATADDFETIITPTDATADATITLPDDTGSVSYTPTGTTTVAGDVLVIPVTHAHVAKTTAGDAEALTLANGENGQILTIDLATDGGGDGTLTPTTKSGFTSIVFADAGDNASLLYVDDTVGWVILGTAGVAAPPVIVD